MHCQSHYLWGISKPLFSLRVHGSDGGGGMLTVAKGRHEEQGVSVWTEKQSAGRSVYTQPCSYPASSAPAPTAPSTIAEVRLSSNVPNHSRSIKIAWKWKINTYSVHMGVALLPTLGARDIIVLAQASHAALRCRSSQVRLTTLTALPHWPRSHLWPTSASAEQCWCWGGLEGTGEQHWLIVHQQPIQCLPSQYGIGHARSIVYNLIIYKNKKMALAIH